MARDKRGRKYMDMDELYRSNKNRETFRAERRNQREDVGRLRKGGGDIDAVRKNIYSVKNLDNFDLSAFGAGGSLSGKSGFARDDDGEITSMGRGVDRLSKADAKRLFKHRKFAEGQSKLEAAYLLRDYIDKLGARDGKNDIDGFAGQGAFRYIDKKIAALEARANNKGVGNPELNTDDPVNDAPEAINTAPGTGPGVDDISTGGSDPYTGGGGGGGNVATRGGAVATGAGSQAVGNYDTGAKIDGDLTIGNGALLNDVNFGTINNVKNYGSGMSGGGAGNGYGSALGSAAAYMDEAEDRFNETSGRDYYLGTSEMGVNRALANEYIDPVELSTGVMNRNMALFGLGNLLSTGLYGQYQPPSEFVFNDIDPDDDMDDQLDALKDLADA